MPKRPPESSICVFSEESPSPLYRYTLEHRWDEDIPSYARTTAAWLLLNPSTADTSSLDPTLRRAKGFSRSWGYGGMVVINLYAFRATLPKDMMAALDPIGPLNDTYIERVTTRADVKVVVAGWGTHGGHLNRAAQVIEMLKERSLTALKLNQDGSPSHPLYLKATLAPSPYPLSLVPTP